LKLGLGKKNFGICGPNGTGKSGVVDAIEFALTGNITRLTGQGTSGITVRSHAPHVDGRDRPEKSRVALNVYIPSLKKKVAIERHVGDPSHPTVTPSQGDVLDTLAELGRHPEFALSRREIIKYVITPPGARSKEVQALLRLDSIEQLRLSLKKIENLCNREMSRFDSEVRQAELQLKSALGIPHLKRESILAAASQRRSLLQLEPISELRRDTSLAGGILSPERTSSIPPQIPKRQALNEMDRLIELLSGAEPKEITDGREAALATLQTLLGNPSLLRNLERQDFLRSGRDLIDDDACPLCDTEWDPEELRSHITAKLDTAREATALRHSVEVAVAPFANILAELESLAGSLMAASKRLPPTDDVGAIAGWLATLAKKRERLTGIKNIEEIIHEISEHFPQGNKRTLDAISDLRKRAENLPEPSSQEEAKQYLVICNERLDVYRLARRNYELWVQRLHLATQLLSIYNETSNSALNKIYKDVEQDFSRFYRFINREDEATFEGKLTPSLGKLGFDVDFYGRGFFPPGAYHSEGHQDGMGLCLYLALMRHTLRQQFTFAVLDDVLMSVDTGHRREVCAAEVGVWSDAIHIHYARPGLATAYEDGATDYRKILGPIP
jgi:hypothetical protein